MYGKVICIPFTKGGYLDFWGFVKDDGRDLIYGAFRTIVHTGTPFMDDIKKTLIQRKRDIMSDYNNARTARPFCRYSKSVKATMRAIQQTEEEINCDHTTTL